MLEFAKDCVSNGIKVHRFRYVDVIGRQRR
jgi:hypothetical protein